MLRYNLTEIVCAAINPILKGEDAMAKATPRRRFLQKAGGAVAAAAVGMQVGASGQVRGNVGGEPPQGLAGQIPAKQFAKFLNDVCAVGSGEVAGQTKGMGPPTDESLVSVMRKYGIPTELPPNFPKELMPMLTATRSSVEAGFETKCSVCSACTICDLCAKLNAGAAGAASASVFTLNPGDK